MRKEKRRGSLPGNIMSLLPAHVDLQFEQAGKRRCGMKERIHDWNVHRFDRHAHVIRHVEHGNHDALSEQTSADGIVPMVVPAVIPQVPGLFEPIAAWGDAVTVVPWALYRASGDDTAIREAYGEMKSWVETVRRRANGFLWEDGRQYGDWLDPDAPADQPGRAKTDPDIVATAYFHRSARLTADADELLGRREDVREYRALADDIQVRSSAGT